MDFRRVSLFGKSRRIQICLLFCQFVFIFQNEKVNAIRIPLNQETAPAEECFDQITALLKNTSASTPIVFNCQVRVSGFFVFNFQHAELVQFYVVILNLTFEFDVNW